MNNIQRIRVWSAPLRLVHWLMALCVLALLASGWIGSARLAEAGRWRDLHFTSGYLLAVAIVIRLGLLLRGRAPTDRWRDLLPAGRQQWLGMRDMLLFYMTLGRTTLPGYYGHNPLWGPVYLVLFALTALGVVTGVLLSGYDALGLLVLTASPWWLGWSLPEWHSGVATTLAVAVAVHVLAVFAHDARGTAGEISAMVNGHKIFVTTGQPQQLANRIQIIPASRRDTGDG
jgi:Ni/Fe-hydrogenase 1 B-type cytochrome subunit